MVVSDFLCIFAQNNNKMGKNYCNVEKKWCKYLKRGFCPIANANVENVSRCPRLMAIETTRLSTLLQQVNFEDVFEKLTQWFSDQEGSKNGYERVFNHLLTLKPRKHNLSDLFILIDKVKESDGYEWLNVHGINVVNKSNITYGIEFMEWTDWVSMFITQETLDTLSKEEIVAGCLYEMTFFGFDEEKVLNTRDKMIKSVEEAKKCEVAKNKVK